MERIYTMTHSLYGENNTTSMKGQKKSFIQSVWNRIGGNFSRSIFSTKMGNPLSVTLVNDEIIMPEFIDKSYIQEKKSIDIDVRKVIETMQPATAVDPFIKILPTPLTDFERYFTTELKIDQQITKQDNKDITLENLIYNMTDYTFEDKSTIESHSVSNVENENSNNINSYSTEIDLQKCTDINKDTLDIDKNSASNDVDVNEEAKSFLIVSHSDVPDIVKPVKKTPISARLSVMCRNAWSSLTTRFYCRTNSMKSEKSIKRSYLLKQHRRRKAIAMGRGRERCQLRRSGVSQTRHRRELTKRNLAMIIEVDYEIYRNDEIPYYGIQNDHSLNDKSDNLDDIDGYDVPDGALLIKQTSPVIFSSSDAMPTKEKPQMPKNQEAIKHPSKVRYVIDASTKSKDYNKKNNTEESPSRSRLLSVSSVDSEDSFIVFEASDDESPKQEYSSGMHTFDSSMKNNEDCNTEIYDMHDNSFRSRLLSECSVSSEDSFIIFKNGNESPKKQEAMKYSTRVRYIVDPLTKINNSYHKDSETCNAQKDTLRPRLLSESSSADSEDSFIVFEGSDDESPKQEETEDLIEIYDISDSSIKINKNHCKDYNKRCMQEDSFQSSESSEDTEDSFCIVFNTELKENCATDNFGYIKTSTPTLMQDSSIENESMIENDEDSKELTVQTKKVSFAPTPVVHIMVTWNYAYRAARKGQWEEMARDNERFKGRINSIAHVLDPILTSKHRSKVWQERFAFQE